MTCKRNRCPRLPCIVCTRLLREVPLRRPGKWQALAYVLIVVCSVTWAATCCPIFGFLSRVAGVPLPAADSHAPRRRRATSFCSDEIRDELQPIEMRPNAFTFPQDDLGGQAAAVGQAAVIRKSCKHTNVFTHSHLGGRDSPRISVALLSPTLCHDDEHTDEHDIVMKELFSAFLYRPSVDVCLIGPETYVPHRGFDICIIAGWQDELRQTLATLRLSRPSVVVIFLELNAYSTFDDGRDVDIVMFSSRVLLRAFWHQGNTPAAYLPPAGSLLLRLCHQGMKWGHRVVYVAAYSDSITDLYGHVLDEAAPYGLQIYGKGWEYTKWARYHKGFLEAEEVQTVYCNSKVILFLSSEREVALDIVSTRLLNAMAVGGGVIVTNYIASLQDWSQIVLLSRYPGEASNLISRALSDEIWRSTVARQAQLAVALDHTWNHRAESLVHLARKVRPSIPAIQWYPTWRSRSTDRSIDFEGVESIFTNPSVAVHGHVAVFAARIVTFKAGRIGRGAWSSSVVLSVVNAEQLLPTRIVEHGCTLQVHAVIEHASLTKHECRMPPGTDDAAGPEDPRVFVFRKEFYVLYSSRALRSTAGQECSTTALTRQSVAKLNVSNANFSGKIRIVAQFALSAPDMSGHEKNWMPFVYSGHLCFIQSLHPYVVLSLTQAELSSDRDELFMTQVGVSRMEKAIPFWNIPFGGGTPLVLVRPPPALGISDSRVYVGVFHVQISYRCYENFAYISCADSPFHVRKLSRALPLLKLPRGLKPLSRSSIAFVTGLTVFRDHFVLTYGSGDTTARISAMPLRDFFDYFV
jgi:hypothetical protein